MATFGVGVRRACKVIKLNRATYYCKSKAGPLNAALRERIKALAAARVRYGYRRISVLLRREGFAINDKRIYRNRAYRLLTIVDIYSRECVALEVAARFCSEDVSRCCNAFAASAERPRFCDVITAQNSSPSRSINGRFGTKSALISRAQASRRTMRLLNRSTGAFVGSFSTHPTSKPLIRREALREFGAMSTMSFARTQCWPTKRRKSLLLQSELHHEADFPMSGTVY